MYLTAAELTEDGGPLARMAVVLLNDPFLAAACLSRAPTSDREAIDMVISEVTKRLGEPFVRLFVQASGDLMEPELSVHEELRVQLDGACLSGISPREKGLRYERFARLFLEQVFSVVECNVRTESGEVDLELEITSLEPFWLGFRADVFAECKNLARRVSLKEAQAFMAKVAGLGGDLGFLVSNAGFTKDALRFLQNEAGNPSLPLIVPIAGEVLGEMIDRATEIDKFLKVRIRKLRGRWKS